MRRICGFLITLALIVGMTGCGGSGVKYNVTMAAETVVDTMGGGTVTDLTNAPPYAAGTVISIKAVANTGFWFVNWTASAGIFDNATAAQTTFIVPAEDVTLTANFAPTWEGSGTEGNPYQIANWYQLANVRNYLDSYFILVSNLDSSTAGYTELASPTANNGTGWQPIGEIYWDGAECVEEPFRGTFDGQGHVIRDLVINRPGDSYVGLFGFFLEEEVGGVIKNLGVVDADVTGYYCVGVLVAANAGGIVQNCYSSGRVTGMDTVGGLLGGTYWGWGTIMDSYSTCTVTAMCYVGGGLVGVSAGTVGNSYSTGNVNGGYSVGGLLGSNWNGTVSNSYYNCDEVLVNGGKVITIGALFDTDFEEWLANGKFLDVNARLSKEGTYYLVNNVSDFTQLLAFGQNACLKFRLKSDLDLASLPNFYIPCLAGEFDGNGHKISNSSFNFDFVDDVGLFGCLCPGGKITNLDVDNVNIAAGYRVGSLVGINWVGTISNCHAGGTVTGNDAVGGLLGFNEGGSLDNCYAATSVTANWHVGGLVGDNGHGIISNSYATGTVAGGEHSIGGLTGSNAGNVTNSYSTGNVSGGSDVGGLAGWNFGNVADSYSTGSVDASGSVGGLIGRNGGYVTSSYSTGTVSGNSSVGGLMGEDYGTVSNCFWDTESSGQATSAGGTGKNTTEMKDITTFSGATWNVTTVGGIGERNLAYIWNIVNNVTYPFLSWQPV